VDAMDAPTGAAFQRVDSLMGRPRRGFQSVAACEKPPQVRYDDQGRTHFIQYTLMVQPGDDTDPFELVVVRVDRWGPFQTRDRSICTRRTPE
jgi:hypothetical protein